MDIVLKGKAVLALTEKSGISKATGNPWKSRTYVIEVAENTQYPKRVAFDLFGDAIAAANIHSNDFIQVHLEINCREYNGNYYNSIRAWKVEHLDAAGNIIPMAAPAQPTPQYTAPSPQQVMQQQAVVTAPSAEVNPADLPF